MTDAKKPDKSIQELIEKFKTLVSEADVIRQQMKEITRQIEARTGQHIGMKSSHDIEVPKET